MASASPFQSWAKVRISSPMLANGVESPNGGGLVGGTALACTHVAVYDLHYTDASALCKDVSTQMQSHMKKILQGHVSFVELTHRFICPEELHIILYFDKPVRDENDQNAENRPAPIVYNESISRISMLAKEHMLLYLMRFFKLRGMYNVYDEDELKFHGITHFVRNRSDVHHRRAPVDIRV